MAIIKAIVVDDEKHAAERLINLLDAHNGTVQTIDQYNDIESAKTGITKHNPDVVFLDVHIHGHTGFDLLRSLNEITFEVIFTTAYDKYALEAFKFSAIDYLLKPIDQEDLDRAIATLQKRTNTTELASKMDVLFHNLNKQQPNGQRIALPATDGISFVPVAEIIRCQANVNYTHFFLKDGTKMTVARTLKSYEQLLEPYNFVRIHNSHLINISHVEKYTRGKGGIVTMSDSSELEVSVRKKEAFLNKMMAQN